MNIKDINPWWKTGKVKEEIKKSIKRELLGKILKYIDDKQIIITNGLRRSGKTVLMHQIIDYLLEKKKVNPLKIFYYDFDLGKKPIRELLEEFKEITGTNFRKEKVWIFLDEVQKMEGWEEIVKLYYDNYNIKFFLSGSSSMIIEKKTKESLAGRAFIFRVDPLNFVEFLKLVSFKIEKKKIRIYEEEIKDLLNQYLLTGGFPEIAFWKDKEKIIKYIKESVIDRVIFIDIPKVFKVEEPELLLRLLEIIASSPGIILEYENLASDLNRDRKTISNYLFYLERAFLIQKLYQFSKNLLTSEKKLKKFYPSNVGFSLAYDVDITKKVESLVANITEAKFFYRKRLEVDIISLINKKILPIEVKYKTKVNVKEIRGMFEFMRKFELNEGLVITKDYETSRKIKDKKVRFMPLWKWLLRQ